jgi:hypothetical protein
MNATERTIVKRIEWLNQETEMLLLCEVQSGSLFYNTSIALPSSELNAVVSDLQKQNPDEDINEFLKIEQWTEEDISFVYDFSHFYQIQFELYRPRLKLDFRQIRA